MTDKCNAACNMCCFSCSPAGKNKLDTEMVKDYIRQAKEMGIKTVSFSGGEAIMHYDELKECMAYAKSLDMPSTLVSNGFWGKDYEKGYEMLSGLTAAGLNALSISVDKFHQEYVPYESVRNAIKIALSLGVMSAVTLMDLKDGESVYRSIEELRPEIYNRNLIVYPVFPAGAASANIPDDQFIRSCGSEYAVCPFDNSITVLFDGTMMMCCTQFSKDIPIVKLGSFGKTSLKDAYDNFKKNDYIYVMLKNGLHWFASLAKELGYHVEDKYTVSCNLCHELFTNEKFMKDSAPYVKKEAGRLRVKKLLNL